MVVSCGTVAVLATSIKTAITPVMLEGPLVTAATVVMVAAVASERTVPKSDENATNLLCCARLKRQFFAAYLSL